MSKKYPSTPPRPKSEAAESGSDHPIDPESLVRLQKVLASAGHGSRRACEELITTGRVDIDGKTVTQLGTKVDPTSQIIRVDGEALAKPKLRYFLVNKPLGVLSTNSDPAGRTRVVDLVRSDARMFTVGRLDKSSEGLIIVTNDGELANLLSHPRYGVEKTYLALVAGEPDKKVFEQLQNGVHLAEGWAHAKTVRIKARQQHSTLLEIVLDEGRNREVRRLLARVGHKVLRLQRIAQGSLRLGNLAPGEYRPLTLEEVELLKEGARESIGKPKPKRPRKTKENTLKFEEPADDLEPSLYDSSSKSESYEADDDDISSGAEVDQFFKSAGSVISDEDEGGEDAPAKPVKKARRVVPASTSLKPIIDLRVKKPAKKTPDEKPTELNVVTPSDDDDWDDGEEDFTAGFPGTGSAEGAADEGDAGDNVPKPRRKMMPGFAKKKEALGKKFDRKNAKFRAERGSDERPRRSFGDGERKPRFGDRAGGGYQGKRPYGTGGAGRGGAGQGGESRGYGSRGADARGGGARGGESRGGFRGKPSGDRPYKPRFNKEGGEASGEGGGERRSFGGRSGTRTPGGGGYQGKRPYNSERSGGEREGGAPRGRRPEGGGFRGKASGSRPFKPRFNEGGEGGDAPQGERKRFAAFNKAKRPYSPRTGEGSGGARGGKPGFGARPGGKPRLNKERTGDGGKTFGRSKFGGKEGGPRKSTGYTGTRRGSGRGFTPKTEGGPSKGGPRGKGKRKKD